MNKTLVSSLALAAAMLTSGATWANELQTLQNMERERATLISTFRDPSLSPNVRQLRVHTQQNRLVDLERMVLRDDRLLGNGDRLVRLTFKNYDLSFLVHASAETRQAPVEHWLAQVGLATGDILDTQTGRRSWKQP